MVKSLNILHTIFQHPDIILEMNYKRHDIKRRAVGVYAITRDDEVVYIGYSMDVRNRIAHAINGVDIPLDAKNYYVRAYIMYVDDKATARRVERSLIKKFKPLYNLQYLKNTRYSVNRGLKQPAGKLRQVTFEDLK